MANISKIEKNAYEKLRERIQNINTMDSDIQNLSLGEKIYKIKTEMIFRKNKETYVVIFFENGLSFILKDKKENCDENDNEIYTYLESMKYVNVRKCKVYEEDKNHYLKMIIKYKSGREMIVIPFKKKKSVFKLCEYIKNKFNNISSDNFKKNELNLIDQRISSSELKENKITSINKLNINQTEETEKPVSKEENKNIVIKIECGKKRILGFIDKYVSLDAFKRSVISQIGQESFPGRQISEQHIEINVFKGFDFFLRDEYQLYKLDSEIAIQAAIKISEKHGRMDIIVKKHEINEDSSISEV